MFLSVVISTAGRPESLGESLAALAVQSFDRDAYQVIVGENGGADAARGICAAVAGRFSDFHYLHDARPGQLVGWHRALEHVRGEVACFIDDDVRPRPGWLAAIDDAFADPGVGLLTGPIQGAFEADPPDWLDHLRLGEKGAETHPSLGLLDFGDRVREIPANFVWGSNFIVRRDALLDAGGFHPCAMPAHLLKFLGDGEIAPARAVAAAGGKVLYHPGAAVDHWIPAWRMDLKALEGRFQVAGIARSFQYLRQIRAPYELPSEPELAEIANKYLRDPQAAPADLRGAIAAGLEAGIRLHLESFIADAAFREWVLRENYLDLDACHTHADLLVAAADDSRHPDWRRADPETS